ncbi:uncharacterized protein LOC105650022 isoform X2 [Jatropha curcas]|uniref:uncharacterized protein LOC105650022 isoform X2 n=1 Tax=Jatropha curcas TaxID=180498 RepID=UPI001895BE99|nr:uncharacterized protein LOC105650022 isoform X2 [Jatropha curcas]
MEGQNCYQNPLELMLPNLDGIDNHVSYGADDDLNQHSVMSDGRSKNMTNSLPLPQSQWFHCQRTPQNYYEFLTENSSLVEKAPTHVLESIPQTVSDSHFIQGMTGIQTELLYNSSGMACGSNPVDSSSDMDAWKLNLHPCIFNVDNQEDSLNVRCLKQNDEGDPVKKCKCLQHHSKSQSHTSWEEEPSEAIGNLSYSRPRAKVAASVFLSNSSYNVSRQRADRQRRERIAERLKALHNLVPQSVELWCHLKCIIPQSAKLEQENKAAKQLWWMILLTMSSSCSFR